MLRTSKRLDFKMGYFDKKKAFTLIKILAVLLGAVGVYVVIFCLTGTGRSQENDEFTLIINEYQTHNENTLHDAAWDTPDWIELYNYGDADINIGTLYLSDDYDNLLKSKLPDKIIAPGEYLIVYASAKDNQADDEIHLNFKLSETDGDLFLSVESSIIDRCEISSFPNDISSGLNKKGSWVYYYTPTPGSENNGDYSASSNIEPVYNETLTLYINEYMSTNKYTLRLEDGSSPDWIELYNPNDTAVNLADYYISDDAEDCGKCRLPEYVLEAGGYVVLLASGEKDADAQQINLNFSLGETDKEIILSDYAGVVKDMRELEPLPADISAGLSDGGEWVYFAAATPGQKNSGEISITYDISPYRESDSPIVINEMMPVNKYGLLDCDGDTSDWIELYNPSAQDIDLTGCALTDDADDLLKWIFPEGTIIGVDEYMIVFLSGKDKTSDGEIHAGFSLGGEDEVIMLVDSSAAVIDSMAVEDLPGNVSKGRTDDGGFGYFTMPTPGKQNTGHYEKEIDISEDILLTDIFISETSTAYISYSRSALLAFEEFIEIYNASDEPVSLSGYSIEDDSGEPWYFPDVYISGGGYMTLQLKGSASETSRVINADLSVSAEGTLLILRDRDDVIIDCYNTGFLTGDVSSGRVIGEGSRRYFFAEKTPAKKNSAKTLNSYCEQPSFSYAGGQVAEQSILLELTCSETEQIRYTTDGKYPTESSKLYTEPIYIDADTVIRAAAFCEGKLPSTVVSRTYIFEREHDLPVVCLSTDPVYLFDDTCGILVTGSGDVSDEMPYLGANYWKNWECRISFEYYDEDNNQGLSFEAGLQVAGQYSRVYDQKSLVVRLRDEYGLDEVYYSFFEDNDVSEYKHILLRSSGQDIGVTKIKDYFIHQSVKGYTDVDIMDGYPVAVYLNGEYWGLYNLREKQNEDYLASHYNIDKDDVTIIKSINTLLAGDMSEWNELKSFIEKNDFSEKQAYEQLCELVDVDAFTDYIIIQSFYGNYDLGNIKYWKAEGGKWKPMLFDTDMALVEETSNINYIEAYFKQSDYSLIFSSLFESESFKENFVKRYAYFVNDVFVQDRLDALIDELAGQIDKEIIYQIERYRYPSSYEKWQGNIEELKQIISTRRGLAAAHLQEVFNLDDDVMDALFN